MHSCKKEKGRDPRSDWVLWQKPLYNQKMNVKTLHKDSIENIDYKTKIVNRLKTVSLRTIQAGYGIQIFPLTAKAVNSDPLLKLIT